MVLLVDSLPYLEDYLSHPIANLHHWDPDCHRDNPTVDKPKGIDKIGYILNNFCRTPDIRSAPG